MSTTIDERVVEMRFDNKHFEENVQTSLGTIKQLRQSLNLTDASKGLDGVSAAARRVDLSGISGAAETVGLKFSAMYTMADQALRNITNSAMNYGKRIVSALTIDPVKTGFSEYETKMGSIQTIMSNTASKGTTMEDVTRVIDELNTYADKTIYNFAEMTRNIGTFTAAGVGLEESASAIQGIANLAAASGSSSQQASTAMYQLSQALSTGTVRLMDWNSVTNAGMGGEKFQEALKATAREHGVAVDDLIEKNGSFRDSLQEGWLSADILNATLRKFTVEGAKEYGQSMIDAGKWTQAEADALIKEAQAMEDAATKVKTFTQLWDTLKESAQSGWSQTWEILIGDFEEAKETLSTMGKVLSDLIGASAKARNDLLQGWKDLGGRTALIESFKNVWYGLKDIAKPVAEAFREIFPALKPEQLMSVTNAIKDITNTFRNAFNPELESGKKNLDNIKRTFKGLFAVLDIVKMAIVGLFKGVASLFGGVGELGGGILDVTAKFGDWLVKLRDAIKEGDVFTKVFKGIATAIRVVVGVAVKLAGAFKENFVGPGLEILHTLMTKIGSRMTGLGDIATGMKNGVVRAVDAIGSAFENCGFFKFVQALWNALVTIGAGIGKAFGALAGGLIEKLSKADFSGILDFLNTLTIGGIAVAIVKFVKGFSKFTDGFSDALGTFGSLKDGVIGILDEVKGCFEAYQSQLKAGTLLKIAQAIAILAASILVISFIDSAKLSASLGAITILFTDLMVAMGLFSKISGDLKNTTKAVGAMLGLSTAVLILSFALANVARLSPAELVKGVAGVVGLTAIMVIAAKALGTNNKAVIKGALQMILFAAAIKILASVAKSIADLSWGQMIKGLTGVGILLAEVSLFLRTAKFGGKAIFTATGIVILAASIKILASACKDFSSMSIPELTKGLTSIAVIIGALIAFTKLTSGSTKMLSIGVGMIALGVAMKIFASAVNDFGSMNWETIGKGLLTMAAALAAIAIAVNFLPATMALSGLGFIAMAAGLVILSAALKLMGGMSWEEIAKSLITMAGAFVVLCTGLMLMPLALPGAGALLVISAALLVLAPALMLLGGMSWGEIARGLIAIAGAFAILGIAGAVLGPLTPAILALAGAIALLGAGCLGIGAGLSLFAAGLTAIAAISTASAAAIAAALTIIVTSLLNLIPLVIQKLGEGLIALCQVIIAGAPTICEAVTAICLAVIQAINAIIPPLMECLGLVLTECLAFLLTFIPQIIDVGLQLILALLDSLAEATPQILTKLGEIMLAILAFIPTLIPQIIEVAMQFIIALVQAIASATPTLLNSLGTMLVALLDFLVTYIPKIVEVALELIVALLEGIASKTDDIVQAAVDIVIAFIDGLASATVDLVDAAMKLMIDFINGLADSIRENTPLMIDAINNLMDAVIDAIVAYFQNGVTKGGELAGKIIDGVKTGYANMKQAGKDLIEKAMEAVKSFFQDAVKKGGELAGKIIDGVKTGFANIKQAGKDLVQGFIDGIKSMLEDVGAAAKDIGSKALNKIKDVLGIKSPSREFIKVGKYSGEGLVNGLKSYSGKVADTAKAVGSSALESMKTAVSGLADAINGDVDSQPTIRPVLDLSDVRSGANTIGSLLNGEHSMGVLANVGAISSTVSRNSQNGTGGDIVSAINKLRQDIGKIGGTSYTIGGITYDDGSNVATAVHDIIRAAKIERRI